MLISSIFGITAFRCVESLLLLVAASAWNGEKDEDPGRIRDIEGDDDELIGISFGAFLIVGGLNAATKSELPPPPKKDDDSISQKSNTPNSNYSRRPRQNC